MSHGQISTRSAALAVVGAVVALTVIGTMLPNNPKGAASPLPAPSASRADPIIGKPRNLGGFGNFAVVIDPAAGLLPIEAEARKLCLEVPVCAVYGWTDPAQLPGAMPMLERETAAQAFAYNLNRNTNFERVLWDCTRWPQPPDRCLGK